MLLNICRYSDALSESIPREICQWLEKNRNINILTLPRSGNIVPCVQFSRISDRAQVGEVDRFDACIGLSCRLLLHKCIGRTIERGGTPNGE